MLSVALLGAGGCGDGIGPVSDHTVTTIEISPASTTLGALGDSVRFTAVARDSDGNEVSGVTVTWASSSPAVATVGQTSGWAVAVANGSATITASADTIRALVPLVVEQRVTFIDISPSLVTPFVGDTAQLAAICRDANDFEVSNATVTWHSSNPAVATVDAAGRVTALAMGTTSISVTTDGTDGLAHVTVPGQICDGGSATVGLVVDSALADLIDVGKAQFAADLCADGYAVVEVTSIFADAVEVRSYLQLVFERANDPLSGAILIGNIPRAYQLVRSSSTAEELISYQFYSDLDGVFSSSPSYRSPGNHQPYSYDVHEGEVDWEIWIGVLPLYNGYYPSSAAAINRYFAKNHQYRTGLSSLPRAFLLVSEHFSATTQAEHEQTLGWLTSGVYAWTPWSASDSAYFYFDSPPANLSVTQGYAALADGVADFFVGEAHGYWGAHGQIDIDWVERTPVRTSFFWSDGCAVGDLDQTQNFLTSLLYSGTSEVILARGSTNNSGGMGTNEEGYLGHNVATYMSQGFSIGDAVIRHVNVPLRSPWSNSREFHFAPNVFLGDPSLRIRP